MIICKECGNTAESADGFCSSCGVLLEWSGQRVEATAGAPGGRPPLPARPPSAERARPQPVPLAAEPAQAGPYCSSCGVRNPGDRTFCRSCGEVLRPGAVAAEPAPGWWRRLLARLRGRRDYAAGDRPRGFLSHDPAPARMAAGPPAAGTVAGVSPAPGVPAVGSPAAGVSAAGVSAARSPAARTSAAGPRPGAPASLGAVSQRIRAKSPRRLALSRFGPLILVVGLLGVGLGPARSWLSVHVLGLEHRAEVQLSQHYVNVVPVQASASSAVPGHRGMLAIDGIQQTYWLTRGDGTGAVLTIRFAGPQDIARVGVLSGEPGGGYTTQARPRTIELVADGRPPVTLSFGDTPGFQNRPVSLRDVTVITVVIKNVYPGQQGQSVALRELEFFARV
jgi:hypothetical protein